VFSLRNRHFFLIDLVLLPATAVLAFALRLDATGLERYTGAILLFIGVSLPVKLLVFYLSGLYRRFWRYASMGELILIAATSGVSVLVTVGLLFGLALPLSGLTGFPRSIPLIDGFLTLLAVGGPRFAFRLAWRRWQRKSRQDRCTHERIKRVLVIGAGDAGAMIVREMQANPQLGLEPVGLVDDDRAKVGITLHGVRVCGTRESIPSLVAEEQIDEVIIAMPTAPGQAIREIVAICQRAGVTYKTMPGIYELISGQVSIGQVREVRIEDLLRRDPVRIDETEAGRCLSDAVVLVTGAGGSIGAELCRQVASYKPGQLVLLGHGENSIYHILVELREKFPDLATRPLIADVRDAERMRAIFDACRPDVVFHTAAHKHVPLMESNVAEAVMNNVFGTLSLLQASEAWGTERFVLVSTDKAVDPVNVMGATKRLAELLVQDVARCTGRNYVAVRFGNVLGSRGSVVPLFQRQIAVGGPVTVTHPEMRRFFMTIPEAVQLIIQAAALGQGGEIFVLDMGEQVRIVDLATELIRLSGLEAGRDVKIVFTSSRPGEKLEEALFAQNEVPRRTRHEKILVAYGNNTCGSEALSRHLEELEELVKEGVAARICAKMQEVVPEYRANGDARGDPNPTI
jgi:FlaA1/EpsC-like NDP-sugar epimerase